MPVSSIDGNYNALSRISGGAGVQSFVSSVTRLRAWIVDIVLLSQGQAISAGIGLFLGIIATESGQVAGEHRARLCRIAGDRRGGG
jgi:xanthine/uracil/vitamin C permease (AzgA family)